LEKIFQGKSRQEAAVVAMLVLLVGHLQHVVHHDDHARESEDQRYLTKYSVSLNALMKAFQIVTTKFGVSN
jgi:hypothetical protein